LWQSLLPSHEPEKPLKHPVEEVFIPPPGENVGDFCWATLQDEESRKLKPVLNTELFSLRMCVWQTEAVAVLRSSVWCAGECVDVCIHACEHACFCDIVCALVHACACIHAYVCIEGYTIAPWIKSNPYISFIFSHKEIGEECMPDNMPSVCSKTWRAYIRKKASHV
jgi:hypothetical protein